jgi:hypothetical protein
LRRPSLAGFARPLTFEDDHFVTLLRAENLDTLPQYLAEQLEGSAKRS